MSHCSRAYIFSNFIWCRVYSFSHSIVQSSSFSHSASVVSLVRFKFQCHIYFGWNWRGNSIVRLNWANCRPILYLFYWQCWIDAAFIHLHLHRHRHLFLLPLLAAGCWTNVNVNDNHFPFYCYFMIGLAVAQTCAHTCTIKWFVDQQFMNDLLVHSSFL